MKGKSPFFLPPSPETPFSPPPARHLLRSPEQEFYLADATPFEERELLDVCSFVETDDLVEVVRSVDTPKPFSGFGSYEQRHGDAIYPRRSGGSRFSAEAPAKLGCGNATDNNSKAKIGFSSNPIDIHSSECSEATPHRRLGKQHSFPVDIDREEAWERKRELYVMDECCSRGPSDVGGAGRTVTRSVSDCGERAWPTEKPLMRSRTRSLTDEDLEELRGCIDLGFGFSSSEDCDLSGTLPALELYYAINRQYNDIKSRMSPDSPLQRGSLYRTSSDDIPSSPLSDSWRISSPGDHPSQVKTRLRHWAQAVACSVKQGFSL
eukprot:c19515_g1_i1 orf=319-1281(+)